MNQFTFVEIPTTDLKRAQRFYGSIFGWKFRPLSGSNDMLALETGNSLNGFLRKVSRISRTAGVLLYVEVPDIDSLLRKVRRARGKVLEPKREMPERGWTAVIASFDGCAFGLWQPHWFQAA
jgi:uncharacterized protein